MQAKAVTVLVADDHEPTRADIRGALGRDERFVVCGEAGNAAAAVALSLERRPDVCLLDVRMPGGGLAALWEIASRLPDTKVVMLTVSEEDEDLFAALRAGAHGYLLKTMSVRRLADALYDVHLGKPAIPRALVARMMQEFRGTDPRRRSLAGTHELQSRLTSREWQVLDLLGRDLTTAAIAERLTLTESAVRAHVAAIVRKLDVHDRAEAIARFRERHDGG
jgi:two-component system NarL family response regulator